MPQPQGDYFRRDSALQQVHGDRVAKGMRRDMAMLKRRHFLNHSDQLNQNNDAYWQSRGEDERPEDWQQRSGDND